jgi:putative tricarboxylic transport membrane protein
MQELNMLFSGFGALLNQPLSLLLSVLGVALGIVIGALPGLTATWGSRSCCPSPLAWTPCPAC